ncbi:MAG: hypothetical protein ACLVJ6_03475 [Merdibacter sp.]
MANRYPQAQTAVNRNSIDISAKGVNKATALSAIARHFHIDPSQWPPSETDATISVCWSTSMVLPSAAIRCWKQQRHTVDDIAEAIAILHDRSTRNADTDNRRTVWK